MPGRHFPQLGLRVSIAEHCMRTPRMESAAGRWVQRGRNLPGQDDLVAHLVRIGNDRTIRGLSCQAVEYDEVWTFVRKKERRLTKEERLRGDTGDFYLFVGLDPETKLVPSFAVGKRDSATTDAFVQDFRQRVSGRPQITTDGFRSYLDAVEQAFGGQVDYATLVKSYDADDPGPGRYSPPKVSGVEIAWVSGNPDRRRICTSYVERNNLTMRLFLKRLNRLTLAFSKKLESLKAAVAFWFWFYNFCWIHRSLRMTPAMAAGVTDRVWDLGELIMA